MRRMIIAVLPVVVAGLFGPLVPDQASAADIPVDRVMAVYFHRTERCPTCLKMGSYSEEAVTTAFAQQLKDGTVVFHYVDFEDPKNAALAQGYGIDGPALIVGRVAKNKVVSSRNLKEIWPHVPDKAGFLRYVQHNVAACLAPSDRVVAMYFHRTKRCPTCLKMGGYSEEAVKTGFARELQGGAVGFYYVDFQNPKNAALVKRYQVTGPALIVAKVVDGTVVDSRNLKAIWSKVREKRDFIAYVQENVAAYVGAGSAERPMQDNLTANRRAE